MSWGLWTSLLSDGLSASCPFIPVSLLPEAGSLVAEDVLLFLPGDFVVVPAVDHVILIWGVLVFFPVALGLVAGYRGGELDCDGLLLLLFLSKHLVGVSGSWVPVFSGHILMILILLTSLTPVALMSLERDVVVVFL